MSRIRKIDSVEKDGTTWDDGTIADVSVDRLAGGWKLIALLGRLIVNGRDLFQFACMDDRKLTITAGPIAARDVEAFTVATFNNGFAAGIEAERRRARQRRRRKGGGRG